MLEGETAQVDMEEVLGLILKITAYIVTTNLSKWEILLE